MRDGARYVKIVEWSADDNCYVGSSPGLLYGGCHGDDESVLRVGLGLDLRTNCLRMLR